MGTDARKSGYEDEMDLDLELQIEEVFEKQVRDLEARIRLQLEEKALAWVEEECKKRLEHFRRSIREEIQTEVENWVERELRRRMDEFRMRSENI
jgi:hypothetical protein